jgi:hypothetical protein
MWVRFQGNRVNKKADQYITHDLYLVNLVIFTKTKSQK